MVKPCNIAGYCRISVDTEQDNFNTSIENQKSIIEAFVKQQFPSASLQIFEDRDRSGYTFEQRENYMNMRRQLLAHQHDILIVKDFSRFARRNSRGLVELEDLRDGGVRIISIDDNIDYPNDDDWLKIQFQFLINEMPVTDASKKVKSVIKNRQEDGRWICAVPYGYEMVNSKQMTYQVDESCAEIVRLIFKLYLEGWGYKRIANHLTELHIPTPRMVERIRKEAKGEECKLKARPEWSIVTVQGILENDFYIGTLRQRKYARKKIKGGDVKLDSEEHVVFESHHEAIIDPRTFAMVQEQRKQRTTSNYRGIKKYDTTYSGFLFCGDCGSPMFSMSRPNLKSAYTCGSYHRRGRKGCTSHHTRVDVLDALLKNYVRRVRDGSSGMLARLEEAVKSEKQEVQAEDHTIEQLQLHLKDAREELKATKRQKIRDITKNQGQAELIEQLYVEMEKDLEDRVEGLQNQIAIIADKRNTVIKANRIAKNVIEIFDDILSKDKLDKGDLSLIVDRIEVFENHIKIKLKSDIDALLCSTSSIGTAVPETAVPGTFRSGTEGIPQALAAGSEALTVVQSSAKHEDKIFHVNIVSEGEPLEIYTDRDGEVIFKKYSPVGELNSVAVGCAEALSKTSGHPVVVCDRDTVIAAVGIGKKELEGKIITPEYETLMEDRQTAIRSGSKKLPTIIEDQPRSEPMVAAPIVADGDVIGSVAMLGDLPSPGELETKLTLTAAAFLAKQLEN